MIIDYVEIVGTVTTPYILRGDTTYFVSGPVYFNGPVTIEGGAVIKYPNDTAAYIQLNNTITCATASYRPAVFTAGDDDNVGESLNLVWLGYTGTINPAGYANPAISCQSSLTLSNCRFTYAQVAFQFSGTDSGQTITLNHAQSGQLHPRHRAELHGARPERHGEWSLFIRE